MTRVKICGIKQREQAMAAAAAGADLIGFVFAPSKRRISPTDAGRITRSLPTPSVKTVGVFVNASPTEVNTVVDQCGLDYVQLSGEEPEDFCRLIDAPIIRTIHISEGMTAEELRRRANNSQVEMIHVDSAFPGSHGGTGRSFNWSILTSLERPFLLAGGLTPANVRQAVDAAQPWGVDVSSGVETDGEKDVDKIRAFIGQVRRG